MPDKELELAIDIVNGHFEDARSPSAQEAWFYCRAKLAEALKPSHKKQSTPSMSGSGRMLGNSDGYDAEGYSCF